MKILIVSQYFFTAEQASSARFIELGGRLAEEGHDVTLVTGMVDHFVGKLLDGYEGRFRAREEIRGMKVVRVWSLGNYRGSRLRRMLNYFSFAATSLLVLLEGRRYDLVLGTSPPLTVGFSGWLLSRLTGARFLFEVRDLWPWAAVEMGMLSNRMVIRASEWLEAFLYRKADHIIALTPGMQRYLVNRANVPESKTCVVTNGFDPEAFAGLGPSSEARRALGVEGEFLVVQAGSMGPSDHLEVLIDAAAILNDRPGLRFLLVGDGEGRVALEERVRRLGLENVRFLAPVPRKRIRGVYAAADALVCHVPPFYADAALPNRFIDYLGTGKPIITSGTGDMASALAQCGSGVVVPPDDPEALAAAVGRIHDEHESFVARGRETVPLAAREYSWDAVFERYRAAFAKASGAAAPVGAYRKTEKTT